jgi:recombinational DNA repair protein RecR
MTIATANMLLNQRLHFGDEQQLAALKFLRQVAEAREKVSRCKHCDGEGLNRRGRFCHWCAEPYDADVLLAVGVGEE